MQTLVRFRSANSNPACDLRSWRGFLAFLLADVFFCHYHWAKVTGVSQRRLCSSADGCNKDITCFGK
jgi:hypothetical protein